MSVELRHLRYLLAVADQGSFTRAAEELFISQPTLSQQVRQLERTLGVQLLDRTGRSVRLTDAGETYVRYARRALRDLAAGERALQDVQDLTRGHLRLAVTPSFTAYLVGPLAAELHERHPGITLTLREMPQDSIESALLGDDIDVGIAFAGAHQQGIDAVGLYTETLGLVVRAEPGPSRRTPLDLRELTDQELVLLSGDFATRGHIDAYFAQHDVTPRTVMEANSIQALIEIVQRTPLASVLPDAVTHDHPHLRPVPLEPALPARRVTLLSRAHAYRSTAARAFVGLVHDVVARRGYPPA